MNLENITWSWKLDKYHCRKVLVHSKHGNWRVGTITSQQSIEWGDFSGFYPNECSIYLLPE
jgi:hypothetical protein